ncbi:MAG: hypothetical protein HY518_00685 [Candidatus Aenigmarchaeota archaeon]|nr:hypothetical protein [Candidatus Aenigmarchaeota archaeon]
MVQEECQISFTYRDTSNALVADGVVGLSMPGPGLIGSSCTPGTTMIIRDVTYTHTPPPALWLPPTNPSFPDAEILDTGNFPDVAVTWDLIACPNSAGQYNVIDIAVQEYQGSFILDDGVSFEVLPPAVITSCGNGVIDPGEQCDDGNTAAGDGCDATCQVELLTTCGDGLGNPATCEAPAETCNTCPLDCGPCLPLIPPPGAIPIPDDKAVFLKAVVAWAAGDTFDVIAGNIATNPVSARYVKVYSGDMYQPVEITLTVGSKF